MAANIPLGLLGLAAGLGQAGRTSPVPLGFGEAFGGALMGGLQAYGALSQQEQAQQLQRLQQLETLQKLEQEMAAAKARQAALEAIPAEQRPLALLDPKAFARSAIEQQAERARPTYGKQVVGGALVDITGKKPKVIYEYKRDKGAEKTREIPPTTKARWERENAAIKNARMALAQFPGGAGQLRKALQPTIDEGFGRMPNPDYNPQLATIWKRASQRLYGVEKDPESLALQTWIIGQADRPFPIQLEDSAPAEQLPPLPIDEASSKPDFTSMEAGRVYTLPTPLQLRSGQVIPAGTKLRWDGKALVPVQ